MSVQTTFKIFVAPYLQLSMQQLQKTPLFSPMAVAKNQKVTLDEYFPCTLSGFPNSILPLQHNGSGDIISNITADGIALHPAASGDLSSGDVVMFLPW